MPDALEIALNHDRPHSIELRSAPLETAGDFDIVLRNEGRPLHVHLNLEPSLARAAQVATPNHFVKEGSIRRVRVAVDTSALPAEGRLKIVTGYGSETAFAPIRLVDRDDRPGQVRVDESLGRPKSSQPEPLVDPDVVPLLALGVIGLLVATLAVIVIEDPVVLLGVLIVIAGIGIAGTLMTR